MAKIVYEDDLYGIANASKGNELKLFLIPQRAWLPCLSFEIGIDPKTGVSEIRLSMLDKNPLNPREKSFFSEKDRSEMIKANLPDYKLLAERALPFVTIQMFYGTMPFVKFVRENGDLKIATNAFGQGEAVRPDSIKYSQIASVVARYFASEKFEDKKMGAALANIVRETSEMINFHSAIREYDIVEPNIEAIVE